MRSIRFLLWLASLTSCHAWAQGLSWQVVQGQGRGIGCNFEGGDPARPVDSWMIANGSDLALVFTNLGQSTRSGPRGKRLVSRCQFSLPVHLEAGYYLANWNQSIQYGIIKPQGSRAGLTFDSEFLRGSGQPIFPMPPHKVLFERDEALNIPLAVATAERETFPESNPRYQAWRKRWCDRSRARQLQFSGNVATWTERRSDGQEVILAVDGLDAKVLLDGVIQACP